MIERNLYYCIQCEDLATSEHLDELNHNCLLYERFIVQSLTNIMLRMSRLEEKLGIVDKDEEEE